MSGAPLTCRGSKVISYRLANLALDSLKSDFGVQKMQLSGSYIYAVLSDLRQSVVKSRVALMNTQLETDSLATGLIVTYYGGATKVMIWVIMTGSDTTADILAGIEKTSTTKGQRNVAILDSSDED